LKRHHRVKPARSAATPVSNGSPVPLESILCTEELRRRPSRPPDYDAENRAFASLAHALADSPRTILQALADKILEVFQAGSAGVSLLTKADGGKRFYWPAIAGKWKPHIGGGTPRDFGPCGDVLDRNIPLLLKHIERRYAYFLQVTPPVEECLLAPFYEAGKAVGTIWVVSHDENRKFDSEDMRQLVSLAGFASSAYQAVRSLEALEHRDESLRQDRGELGQHVEELRKASARAQDSHRAALNLMEDAVQSRQAMEKLNAELRESEKRYRTLFDLGPVAVYSIDLSGVILDFNRRAAELWGREPAPGDTDERFCGSDKMFRPDGSFMPHEQCPMAEVVSGKKAAVHDGEVIIERPDRSRVTVIVNIRPLTNDCGEVVGAINCFYDITQRKESEGVRARLAAIVESSEDAIISKDLNGVIMSWNRGAQRLFGYTAKEAVGQSITLLIPPERFDEEPQILARIRKGEAIDHYETIRRCKDGTLLDISLTVSPIRNQAGEIIGASKIARDITDRIKTEKALRESQALLANHAVQLEQLVNERTARLQETIGELEHFSYTITHDMRAPLRAMQGFGDILLSKSGDCLTSENADYLRRIMDAANRMDALIRDSLQYTKIVREKIPLAVVEPAPVLRGVLESYPSLQPPHVEIQITEPLPAVIANAGGLAQCFSNLIANAIKFVKPGKVPHVRVWTETRGDFVRFWFQDNGIGIPKEYQDRIFGMFQQLDKSYEGTGIGLALVRKTAERMDGKVGVKSEPGKGSRFWLEFKKANP